jgi:type IV secretion system protein VirD4
MGAGCVIKGDLYKQTAGYRSGLGPVFRFDTRGNGNTYDPLEGKSAEDELYDIAKQLMYEPHEGEGKAFTQRATKMLTLLWLACLELNNLTGKQSRLLPFLGQMADLGLNSAAAVINDISPVIARRFLDGEYDPEHDYSENKFLSSSWESLTARLYPLLTERILRCLNGSDFIARDIIAGKKPVTVYICVPEKDLHSKSPIIRLVLESLMGEMKDYFDTAPGETAAEKGCREVLYILDEAGNVNLPSLPNDVSTVRSRGISIWGAYQDNSQIDSQYHAKAEAIRNNMDTKILYRQSSFKTCKDIAESLGWRSAFTRSQTIRDGQEASESLTEHAVHLLTPRDIYELALDEVLILHSNRKPIRAKRMDWQNSQELTRRRAMTAPLVHPLPQMSDQIFTPREQRPEERYNEYIDPDRRY